MKREQPEQELIDVCSAAAPYAANTEMAALSHMYLSLIAGDDPLLAFSRGLLYTGMYFYNERPSTDYAYPVRDVSEGLVTAGTGVPLYAMMEMLRDDRFSRNIVSPFSPQTHNAPDFIMHTLAEAIASLERALLSSHQVPEHIWRREVSVEALRLFRVCMDYMAFSYTRRFMQVASSKWRLRLLTTHEQDMVNTAVLKTAKSLAGKMSTLQTYAASSPPSDDSDASRALKHANKELDYLTSLGLSPETRGAYRPGLRRRKLVKKDNHKQRYWGDQDEDVC